MPRLDDDLPQAADEPTVIGKLPPQDAIAKLRELGDHETADALQDAAEGRGGAARPESFSLLSRLWPRQRMYHHTSHAFGHIADGMGAQLDIRHAGNIEPDASLQGARVKITLDGIRAADYPGGGVHRVLFRLSAQNQVQGQAQTVHFNTACRVREGERAAILGYPIFIGLGVGAEGLAFRCLTVNVDNQQDEQLLQMIESDVAQSGLKLLTTAQPALAPLSAMAVALTKALAARHRNVAVQDILLGLDFSRVPTRGRLAEGSYVAVQIPESLERVWTWDQWLYDRQSGSIVDRDEPTELVPYNYVIFSISRYQE